MNNFDSAFAYCSDATPVFFGLLDFSIAPPFLYYSYIPLIIVLLGLSVFVLISDKFSKRSIYLSGIGISLSLATLSTLLSWIAAPVTLVMFAWQMWNMANVGIFVFATLFAYAFVYKKDFPILKILTYLLFLPAVLLTPTVLNIDGFDYSNCEGIIGPLFTYSYAADVILSSFIVFLLLKLLRDKSENNAQKREHIIVVASTLILLFTFLITTVAADYFGDYRIEMIGAIGGMFFVASMGYLIGKFREFNSKALATELLVVALLVTVGSIVFVQSLDYVHYVGGISFILVASLGYLLSKSVRNEVKQRKEIEKLAHDLAKANDRLKELDKAKSEFVSIASHQLRSPLTSIRGYSSMLADGSYGPIPEKATAALKRIEDSSRLMAMAIEDYLNVSRIEAGNMKYNLSDFNLKDEVEKVTNDIRSVAMEKGLILMFRTDLTSRGVTHADLGKTVQIIHNLINNAMKYTPKGSITVYLREDVSKKRLYVDIMDTGIGISASNLAKLFQKFSRADNANSVNVSGTGLGLFVALKMAEAMGGTITAHSEGDGKGSKFTLEMPLVM